MSEQLPDALDAPEEKPEGAARPPLSVRAGAAGKQRLKQERFVRGLDVGKDETFTSGFFFGVMVCALRIILKALGLYGRGMRNARKLVLVQHDIAVPGLPEALDGFRILHISDFHFPRRHPEFSKAVGKLLNGLEVELCALTGDYRYGYFGPADHVVPHLRTALQGVKSQHGTYAVLGNHDLFITGQRLEKAGFPVLYNEGLLLHHKDCPFWLCGIDEPHYYKCDDLNKAVQGRPENTFTIVLAHSPERVHEAAEKKVSLYLAGHTHGGQIRLPYIGALVSNARCARKHVWGPWRYNKMAGHTTCGIGATDVPVRFNCPPEAALLRLRCDKTGA